MAVVQIPVPPSACARGAAARAASASTWLLVDGCTCCLWLSAVPGRRQPSPGALVCSLSHSRTHAHFGLPQRGRQCQACFLPAGFTATGLLSRRLVPVTSLAHTLMMG